MALTGLQIQKLLPKTNCKECGSNTCLAFAMKLASKKASLADCPYASDEAKKVLGAMSEPPVGKAAFGPARDRVVGEETVLYRHEKTFVHETLLAVNIDQGTDDAETDALFAAVSGYELERVGQKLRLDMISVTQRGEDDAAFAALCRRAYEATGLPVIAGSDRPSGLAAAAAALAGTGGLLASATPETADALTDAARNHGHALALTAPDMESLAALSARVAATGFADIVLAFQTKSLAETYQTGFLARRAALKDSFKPLGRPHLRFVKPGEVLDVAEEAVIEIGKYGGVCVLPYFDPALLAALMTLRQNIYTDPQKPIQVEPGLYAVGEPGPDAPVFVTTNFSLTYFLVSGEIENSGLSAWLAIPECEGMSVLTAWAAGKFNGASIGKFFKEAGVEDKVTGRTLVIPGHVAHISGEAEEHLPGWKALVGPQEAADLESFIKLRLA